MAVLGASGAGKSTFLDILARKSKRGTVGGQVLVNGRKVSSTDYRRVVGFVDQEDTLMGTLTVYETVLYSALLRLPREMSFEDKRMRTLETMHELGIIGIRDSRIGESGRRSISGGEKRRVSIACELVTSPSILFLDEPTSGLDSYNAYNVVESLVQLARNYKRTVIFTIHQPQSNIVALFDKLLLLASGKVVYSGKAEKAQRYFESIGCSCPPGFNIADYLSESKSGFLCRIVSHSCTYFAPDSRYHHVREERKLDPRFAIPDTARRHRLRRPRTRYWSTSTGSSRHLQTYRHGRDGARFSSQLSGESCRTSEELLLWFILRPEFADFPSPSSPSRSTRQRLHRQCDPQGNSCRGRR